MQHSIHTNPGHKLPVDILSEIREHFKDCTSSSFDIDDEKNVERNWNVKNKWSELQRRKKVPLTNFLGEE